MSHERRSRVVTYLCERPARSLLAAFLLSFVGAAAVSLVAGPPLAEVHDELSYLLAADTYASGRLANPPHPHWEHFESPQILQQPTYASKYQPAQGLLLALGQILCGSPLLGLWLGAALMSAAVTWMLQAFLPARWALLGGLLTVLQFGLAGAWAQSYWGGAIPACGGALLFGAYARLSRAVTWCALVALAGSALILMFSRPFEGLVLFLVVSTPLLLGRSRLRGRDAALLLASLAGTALVGGAFQLKLNQAVTGDPLLLPYQQHTAQYGAVPLFLFQDRPATPEYGNERLRRFHTGWEAREYEQQRSVAGFLTHAVIRPLRALLDFGFGPPTNRGEPALLLIPSLLFLPLVMLPWLLRRRRARFALLAVVLLFAALASGTYFVPHYVAVLAGAWIYLAIESLRLCRAWLRRGSVRQVIVPLAVIVSLLLLVPALLEQRSRNHDPERWSVQRARLQQQLIGQGGRHLVLVQYAPDYNEHHEWVYNSAEIDGQDLIWARQLGPAADAALLEHYADRRASRLSLEKGAPPRWEPVPALDPGGR